MADAPDPSLSLGEFARLKAWVKTSLEKHSKWYADTTEAFDFVAGRQWTSDDEAALKASNRVPVVYNRVGVIVDSICGMEVNNRQEVKYLPRTVGASKINERLSSLGDWARDECQAEDEESEAFRDAVICGRGWTETRMDFGEDPMGRIVVERVDPRECGVDPGSRKANFADSRYRWRFRDLDTAEAEAMFPDLLPHALNATWASNINLTDGGEGNKRDYPSETRSGLRDAERPKTVRVVQIQWWDERKVVMVALPGEERPREFEEGDWEQASQEIGEEALSQLQVGRIRKRTYYQAFLGHDAILGQDEKTCFTLNAITGKRDVTKGYHYGVVRGMIDPARVANKYITQTMRIVDTNAKGGLLAEKGVFVDERKAQKDWSDPTKVILVNEGAISGNRIKDRTAPPAPETMGALIELAITSIRDVVGTNVEALGQADREQAASLEYQRRQSAMTILAPLFDGLRRYRKTQGVVMIEHLRLLPPGVIVRVIGNDEAEQNEAQSGQPQKQFEQFDPAAFGLTDEQAKFDVIVDEAPTSPNQKEATWGALQPFLPQLAQMPGAMSVALKYSPLPQAASQELALALSGSGQLPPEAQKLIQEGQQTIQQQGQRIQQLEQDQSVKVAGAQTNQFKAETDRLHKLGPDDGMPEWFKVYSEEQKAQRDRELQILLQQMKDMTAIEVAQIGAGARAEQMNGAGNDTD